MKHNLKNRPSHEWMLNNLDKIEKIEEWFKGFEKEQATLQQSWVIEVQDALEKNFPKYRKWNIQYSQGFVQGYKEGYLQRGKDILGDSP